MDLPTQNEQQLCREELVSKLAGDVDDGLTYCEGEGESQLNTSEDDGDWEHSKMLCVEHKSDWAEGAEGVLSYIMNFYSVFSAVLFLAFKNKENMTFSKCLGAKAFAVASLPQLPRRY